MAIVHTLRGADIKVYINSKLFRPVTGLSFTINTGRKAINGIDINTPFELAPGSTRITGSMEIVRARMSGGLEGQGVSAPQNVLLMEKYFSLALVDRMTDSVVLYIEECSVVDQNWHIPSRGIMTGSFTFEGIGWANEAS
jgi:hypothetical protein